MFKTIEQNTPFITGGGIGRNKMTENDAVVLLALPPTDRREELAALLQETGFGVVTADDGIEAVGAVRDVDAVLVGGYPDRITAAVVNATTPPAVSRPNVLLESRTEPSDGETQAASTTDPSASGDAADATRSPSVEPDTRLPATATNEAILDAVESAVARSAYRDRVSEFSEVAARAANTEYGSQQLAGRVTTLAEEARRFQDAFSDSDWTATFRTMSSATDGPGSGAGSGYWPTSRRHR